MTWYRTAFGAHYRVLYAHRDDAEARRCVRWLVSRLPLREGLVLDLGCGDGRHLRELSAAGVPVIGLDLSAPLLAAARQGWTAAFPARRAPLVRADMRRLPLAAGRCLAVLSLFTAFGYFGPLVRHTGVVAEIHRVLVPGGWWVLDYLDALAVRRELAAGPRSRTGRRGPLTWRSERRLACGGRQVVKETMVRPVGGREAEAAALGIPPAGRRLREEVALFTPEELAALAEPIGLRLVDVAGDYDGDPPRPGSPRRIMLLQREEAP